MRRLLLPVVVVMCVMLVALQRVPAPARAAASVAVTDLMVTHGYDVSYPQCGYSMPTPPMDFVVIGLNGGKAMTQNPCFGNQLQWARSTASASVYLNTNSAPITYLNPNCRATDYWCESYYYGREAAAYALNYANSSFASGMRTFWLDVETGNYWTSDTVANSRVIQGMTEVLVAAGKQVGIYSTSLQFGRIAGSYQPQLPLWAPLSGTTRETAGQVCRSAPTFGGGTIVMVQVTAYYDENFTCPPRNLPHSVTVPNLTVESPR
ncbi:MAG TPA: hypothetical protein VIK11_12710 [Tepidiformaceae bacterium]